MHNPHPHSKIILPEILKYNQPAFPTSKYTTGGWRTLADQTARWANRATNHHQSHITHHPSLIQNLIIYHDPSFTSHPKPHHPSSTIHQEPYHPSSTTHPKPHLPPCIEHDLSLFLSVWLLAFGQWCYSWRLWCKKSKNIKPSLYSGTCAIAQLKLLLSHPCPSVEVG